MHIAIFRNSVVVLRLLGSRMKSISEKHPRESFMHHLNR
ncbi:Choline-glycine betaine transporter [Pseudomonas syringae pv. actinidiae]|nr:Choline-glycine betaine transporter [Pseudomonas syringae pv. actinidiae]